MNNIKKIFAVLTAAAAFGVMAMCPVTAYADEADTTTTTTTEDPAVTTTTTTTAEGETTTTAETTTTTVPVITCNTWLTINGTEKEDAIKTTFSVNGDYTVTYKFADDSAVNSIDVNTDIDSSVATGVKLKVKEVKFDGETLEFKDDDNNAFALDENQHYCLHIIAADEDTKDAGITEEAKAKIVPEADKVLTVTFTAEGLAEPEAPTTTAASTTQAASYTVRNSYSPSSSSSTTSTVAQTADPGMVAIIASTAGAAALAVCAAAAKTDKKKKRK